MKKMKNLTIKIILLFGSLFFQTQLSYAQMIDVMGNIGIGSVLTTHDIQNTNRMNQQMQSQNLLHALSMKIAENITSYMGNYHNMPDQKISVGKNVITLKANNSGQNFSASVHNVTSSTCRQLVSHYWDGLVSILVNNKTYSPAQAQKEVQNICQGKNNISLIFQ